MTPSSIGDLAQSFVQRRANAGLNREMAEAAKELTTGWRADIGTAMSGDTRPLASLERSLTGLAGYRTATTEATVFADATQASLDRISGSLGTLRDTVLSIQQGGDPTGVDASIEIARESFDTVVAALNTQVAGRSLFAGTATDGPALRTGTDILADIGTLVSAETDPAEVSRLIDAYFGPGGDFLANDYLGSDTSRAPYKVSSEDEVRLALRADDADLRQTLATLAKSAVLSDGASLLDDAGRASIVRQSGDALLGLDRTFVKLRASVGVAQARIEEVATRNGAERAGLEEARLAMIASDPYEAAVRIEQVEVQLQSLYSMTARMSRLNLTSYL